MPTTDPDNACPVIIMAKAPRPGHAKTRLIPALGAQGAASLAGRLLAHACEQAAAARLGDIDLCCTPHPQHPAFAALAASLPLQCSVQTDGDLGARMQAAFARWLPVHGQALMIGTDCPALNASLLRAAAQALQDADAVFIPAFDGGYVLIGLRGAVPARFDGLFADMPWSTPGLMAATRVQLAQAGLRHVELPPLPDIDEPTDLQYLPLSFTVTLPGS